jgi:hypothetical protein
LGGADTNYQTFRVEVHFQGELIQETLVSTYPFSDWARTGIGSGLFRLDDPEDGFYEFFIHPTIGSTSFESTPDLGIFFIRGPVDAHLDPPAINGTPEHAFASHGPRVSAVTRQYARVRPVRVAFLYPDPARPAGEGDTIPLIAHLQAASEDPEFSVPGELPSLVLVHVRLRQLTCGKVGTNEDYDFALKGLMVILYRYRDLLTDDELNFILDYLVPLDVSGPLNAEELLTYPPVSGVEIASETENHVA